MSMKLWLLRPSVAGDDIQPWSPPWDKFFGFVVRAETEGRARRIANDNNGDETKEPTCPNPWLTSRWTSCVELLPSGDEGIVMSDYNAG